MKKTAFLAAILVVSAFPLYSYGKGFLSQEKPAEVEILMGSLLGADLVDGKSFYSGKTPGINDYLLKKFSVYLLTSSEVAEDSLFILFEVSCPRDFQGNLIPWQCDGAQVAVIFVNQKVSWFKSQEVKTIFETMTKATQ